VRITTTWLNRHNTINTNRYDNKQKKYAVEIVMLFIIIVQNGNYSDVWLSQNSTNIIVVNTLWNECHDINYMWV
jgi:hypothetical protein